MTIKSIIEAFENQQVLLNYIFKSFTIGEEWQWSQDQQIMYPNIFAVEPTISFQTQDTINYKMVLIFSDRSFEGNENHLEIKSNLNTGTLIYINDFINNYIDNNNLQLSMGQPTYLHYQEQGNDRSYKIRAEFNVAIPIALCVINFTPICLPAPPVCNVVLDNAVAFIIRSIELNIRTTFTNITGINYFEVYLRDSLSAYSLVNVENNPQLINVFDIPFPGPETYFVRIDWFDTCGGIGSQEFGPFVLP